MGAQEKKEGEQKGILRKFREFTTIIEGSWGEEIGWNVRDVKKD